MKTFLHENSLTGKIVYPFTTNGGWIGHTFRDFKAACKDAEVRDGLNIRFDEAVMKTAKREIAEWASKIVMKQ